MVHLAHLWGKLVSCPNRHRRQTSPYSPLGESYKREKPSPTPFSLEHRKVSRCSLPPPHPAGPVASAAGRGVHSGTHRTEAPKASLQAPSHSAPISDPCHCRLPPKLSPLSRWDTDVPDQAKDYISQRPWRHRMVSQPASPSMPESIISQWVGLPLQ